MPVTAPPAPGRDCSSCLRLAAFRAANRAKHPQWHNAPVESFGALGAPLLIVGLAPGLRGANQTGRPFTGDFAGDLLYATLAAHGFTTGTYGARADDGFALRGCRVTNAVRCVPPENKPERVEFAACRPYLQAEIAAMPGLRVVLALGRGAHDQCLHALNATPLSHWPFAHGARHYLPAGPILADSYHCSRYNTNPGRLTPEMFSAVVGAIRAELDR